MGNLQKCCRPSTIGKKLVMGITGLGLVIFVIAHLIENLQLYMGPDTFNGYVVWLHGFGPLLTAAEVGLGLFIVIHAIMAIRITKTNYDARGSVRYSVVRTKGEPSHSNIASRNMIVTGIVLLLFLGLHIWQFRFGPGIAQGYGTILKGRRVLDLYRLVSVTFHNPYYVGIYVAVMLFLGTHLSHGFWSSFQSLGVMSSRWTKLVYFLGLIIGALLAVGFLTIPLWFYFWSAT